MTPVGSVVLTGIETYWPELRMIPPVTIFPELDRPVKVPTLVMLGCAAVVTVPAVVADVALVADVAVVAVVAEATAPTTLAPGMFVSPAPLP